MLGGLLRWIGFVALALPFLATGAHLLEAPNKLALEGPLSIAVQQKLYAGWAPFFGAMLWTAFVAVWGLALASIGRFPVFLPTVVAALCVSSALGLNVMFVQPLDAIFASWTPTTLPQNWAGFRLHWQLLQLCEFALFLAGYWAMLRAALRDWYPGR
jgi:hypothetical protein